MAAPTLAPLPVRTPTHPVLSDVLDQAELRLGQCDWSELDCDCRDAAVVHHLQSELEYCLSHFRKVRYQEDGREAYWAVR